MSTLVLISFVLSLHSTAFAHSFVVFFAVLLRRIPDVQTRMKLLLVIVIPAVAINLPRHAHHTVNADFFFSTRTDMPRRSWVAVLAQRWSFNSLDDVALFLHPLQDYFCLVH